MFKLIISPKAQKELKRIKKTYQPAVKLAFEDIKEDPEIGSPLDRNLTGKFSYRVGVYRIIYKINQDDKVVNILSAGHHGVIYN